MDIWYVRRKSHISWEEYVSFIVVGERDKIINIIKNYILNENEGGFYDKNYSSFSERQNEEIRRKWTLDETFLEFTCIGIANINTPRVICNSWSGT